MRGQRKTIWGARVAAVAGLGGLLFTVGCGASQTGLAAAAQPANVAQPGTPVVVGCEPNQRTMVRPSVVNGVVVSQVDCVSAPELAASAQNLIAQQPAALPISYRPAASTVVARNADLGDTRIIPASASYPATAARPVSARQVVYDDRPVREVKPRRSVQKSAIIIGSSAGVGAGVGAAVGGKKGALLGALIGGGGATLWDQVTRRQ
jgi:hypothetical protein